MIYSKINELCAVRNTGKFPSERFMYIYKLAKSLGFDCEPVQYKHSRFPNEKFYNLYLKGSGSMMAIAHHDIVDPRADNANDNSASVINCLALKQLMPSLNVCILDGEEPPHMGAGSGKLAFDIKQGRFGTIAHVLNLELTGIGGESFFVGKLGSKLEEKIIEMFDPIVLRPPFNDSDILMRRGIDSTVVTTVPLEADGRPMMNILGKCHSSRDSVSSISTADMKIFVEKVALPILRG